MTAAAPLLAKSGGRHGPVSLCAHSEQVARAAGLVFGSPGGQLTELGNSWLRFFRLPASFAASFQHCLSADCWLHDLGKCNQEFQALLKVGSPQSIRHEHLPGLLLFEPSPLSSWLARVDHIDRDVVAAAILCHHLKVNEETLARPMNEADFELSLPLVLLELLTLLAHVTADGICPSRLPALRWRRESVLQRRKSLRLDARQFKTSLCQDRLRFHLTAAVKAALIIADAAGSAVTRGDLSLDAWISLCFGNSPCTPDWLTTSGIDPVVREFEQRTRRKLAFRDWQLDAARLNLRALLLSPCGSGQTLAAWLWIREQLRRRPAARIIFLYPTRAAATEGFRGYGSWEPNITVVLTGQFGAGSDDAALLHGTSDYDLEGLFQKPSDPRTGQSSLPQETLFALSYWHRCILTDTVDQFLSFLNCNYASVCLLPLLADSVLVIYEVHSFDASMFKSIERLLTDFDVPVLCMTATLPQDRVRTLVGECGLQSFPDDPFAYPDLHSQSSAPRYRVTHASGQLDPIDLALQAAADGKKVLWVANTVRRAQGFAIALRNRQSARVHCYYSRFRLSDRRDRHREAVDLFAQPGGRILVSTQVCEMSLDLDADLLIAELAPVPALIQRMGRCCGHALKPGAPAGEVFLLDPPLPLPYSTEDMIARQFFGHELTRTGPMSQLQLGERLSHLTANQPHASGGLVGFLNGGMYAMAADESFRDTNEFTVDAVLDTDLGTFLQLCAAKDSRSLGFLCPVQRRMAAPTRVCRLPFTWHHHVFTPLSLASCRRSYPMSENSITLTVDPFLLPTTQHRAGLAGLMVLTETMRRRGMGPLPGIRPDTAGRYLITLTQASLCSALNDLYDATLEEHGFPNKLNGSPASGEAREPKRVEKQTDQKTRKDKTVYIYDQLVPKAAFLHALGMPPGWIKLWRDAVWATIRGVPKTRLPFESRRDRSDVEDAARLWLALRKLKEPTLDIASSLLIGAQAVHADNIPFQGRPSETLLLHFWPVVMGVFEPQSLDRDGKASFDGYVLAIPDVVDFQAFVQDFTEYVAGLSPDMAGFRPRPAVISVPEEGGLEYAAALAAIARARHRETSLHFSTASVETYHLQKRGNNILLLHSGRVPADPGLLHSYEAIRNRYNHPAFRRQLILNLLRGSSWYSGFHDLFSRFPSDWFLGASGARFQFDFYRKTQIPTHLTPQPNLEAAPDA